MGLKASKLFAACFRASDNPVGVVRAFMYARHNFFGIYLASDVQCDRLVFPMLIDASDSNDRESAIREFVFWAIYYAEIGKISWDMLFDRLLNALTIDELSTAIETNIEWHGTGNKPKEAWNGEGGLHLRNRIGLMRSWDTEITVATERNPAIEQFITNTATRLIADMPFKQFIKGMPK